MIFGDLRRSDNIEDRRRRRVAPEISQGVFSAGQPVPNVFDVSEGLLTGLGPDDFANEPIGPLSREAGVDDVARSPEPVVPAEPARWAMGAVAAQDQYNPEEGHFQTGIRATPWFSEFKQKYGEEPNLNDPDYDYRAAWHGGARPDVRDPGDRMLHWPSQYKGPNHPNRFVDGVDTREGADVGVYRGMPRLDPGLRRAPGDTQMRPVAETVGQVVGDLVIPQDPLDYAAMFALGPAGKLASKGVRAGALAMGGVLGLSDEAEAGKLKAIKQGIKAYHSSPHDFEKFDASKIGTGEGAQVYGHGLYFAENPAVSGQGGQYWQQFARRFQTPDTDPAVVHAVQMLEASGGNRAAALAKAEAALASGDYRAKTLPDATALLRSDKPVGPRTYEVNIRADPAQMLDWDKALTGQHPSVQSAIERYVRAKSGEDQIWRTLSGEEINLSKMSPEERRVNERLIPKLGGQAMPAWQHDLMRESPSSLAKPVQGDAALASQRLQEAGIPGIKYLDQGSRFNQALYNDNPIANEARKFVEAAGGNSEKAGKLFYESNPVSRWATTERDEIQRLIQTAGNKPTSNYVVFDPSIVDILKKYGIAGAAAPMGALAAQDEYR